MTSIQGDTNRGLVYFPGKAPRHILSHQRALNPTPFVCFGPEQKNGVVSIKIPVDDPEKHLI